MLQKIYFMVFERYIPELKKYDSISFLHQPMTSGQPLKIVQRHMAHPVDELIFYSYWHHYKTDSNLCQSFWKEIYFNSLEFFLITGFFPNFFEYWTQISAQHRRVCI